MFAAARRHTIRILTTAVTLIGFVAATTVATALPAQAVPASTIFDIAAGQIKTLEGPAADKYFSQPGLGNHSTYTTPWCAAFVTWVSWMAGASTFKSASVDAWVAGAQQHKGGLSIQSRPRAGDLVAFKWDSNKSWDHIGIVTSVGDGYYWTIEGNTSQTSNGPQGVWAKRRAPSDAYAVTYIKLAS